MITRGPVRPDRAAAESSRLISSRSGALSCTRSASATASSSVATTVSAPSRRGGASDSRRSRGGRWRPSARRLRAPRGWGRTGTRRRRSTMNRAAQPPPITPPPSRPTARPAVSHGRSSPSFVRASSGPSTRTFMPSRIVTARSTSSPLVASTPGRASGCPPARPARSRPRAPPWPRTAAACDRSQMPRTRRRPAAARPSPSACATSAGAPYLIPVHSWIKVGVSSTPAAIMSCTITRWPVSNTSSSGLTPSSCTCAAIAISISGVFIIT